jgi:hypothetical protein
MAHFQEPPIVIYLFDTMAGKEWAYDQVRHTFLKHGFIWSAVVGNDYEPLSRFEGHPNERSHRAYADALFKADVAGHLMSELPIQIVPSGV